MNLEVFVNISLVTILVFFNIINRSESVSCDTPPKNTEARLQQRLFCNYDKEVRPISNSKNVTIVKLVMYLKSFEYSEYQGTITLNSWMTMKWYDDHLKWNKREFDNIDTLTVHSEDIWKPDLTVYHSESTQYDEACSASHCDLQYDGHISCIPPCSHSGFCNADYNNWPFDVQKCVLNLGTWMHKGSEVNFQAEKVVIEKKGEKSNEWKLTSIKSTNLRGNYSCCPNETYPSVKFTVVIERFSAAEETYIVAPALIFCVINLIIVWLNPVCSERITLAIVSMFLHVLLIQQLSWLVPKNGNAVPKALIYFRDSLVIGAFLLLDTIIKKGLLACQADTPSWIKSTTSTLRGNKFGQLMFTNPYLINQAPLDNDALINEERINSIEEQSTESSPKKEERNIWFIVVRVMDTLTFLILLLVYLIMIFGWIPTAKTIPEDVIGDVVVEDE